MIVNDELESIQFTFFMTNKNFPYAEDRYFNIFSEMLSMEGFIYYSSVTREISEVCLMLKSNVLKLPFFLMKMQTQQNGYLY
jgi:hypothetical protein